MIKKITLICFVGILCLLKGCNPEEKDHLDKIVEFDFDKIKERGKLIALTGFNAYSYFVYKGQTMGFEYELVNKLADHLKVDLEIKIVKDLNKMFEMLNNGDGDLIAFNLTVTKERLEKYSFTAAHHTTKQVLIQRRPENWRRMRRHMIDKNLIRNPIDLEEKTVHVRSGSAFLSRLRNLSDEIGGVINIIEAAPESNTEDLIRMVADGEIDYTISDENVAILSQAYLPDIDVGTEVSFPQKIAWAVRKNAPMFLDSINTWLDQMRKKPEYYYIYSKYYKNRSAFRTRLKSQFFSNTSGKISKYDDLLKQYSEKLEWDWRILASLIYQESQFDPTAKSWAGAVGLMQLMPATAKSYGAENPEDPLQSLNAGINYLVWLDDFWKKHIEDQNERIKFVLASYNIGFGHILDARNLAEKFGADPDLWYGNVEYYLLQKSKPKFYNDDVVRNGYSRGVETVNYVKEVLDRYDHYRQFVS
jgi:membrane-bound lytic murein transglycosylase F